MSRNTIYLKAASNRVPAIGKEPIAYIGCPGQNLGDQVMFEIAQSIFGSRRLFHYKHPKAERRLAKIGLGGRMFFSSAVLGGGTLIHRGWAEHIDEILSYDIPVATLGTGAGSGGGTLGDKQELQRIAPRIQRIDKIGLRGPRSCRLLQEAGVNSVNLKSVGDLALYPSPVGEMQTECQSTKKIAFTFANHSHVPVDTGVIDSIVESIRWLTQDHQYRVIPVLLNSRDEQATVGLLNKAHGKKSVRCDIRMARTLQQFSDSISDCEGVISSRLHGSILAARLGKPCLILAAADKQRDFSESINWNRWTLNLQSSESTDIAPQMFREFVENLPELNRDIRCQVKVVQDTLYKYIDDVRNFLGHGNHSRFENR